MNNITEQIDKNYALTKKVIEDMLINNTRSFIRVIGGMMPMPIESATCYIVQGVQVDGEDESSTGYAIYNGELVSVYGGTFTGFYQYVETPTIIEGVDSFGNQYRTEIINKKIVPAMSGIAYEDMVRIELAIKEQFKSNPSISTGLNSRFAVTASNCHLTQFGRAQYDVDYIESSSSTIISAGWNEVHTLPLDYVSNSDVDIVGSATLTHGTVVQIVPIKITAGVLQFYVDDGFTTGDFHLNVRLNYSL